MSYVYILFLFVSIASTSMYIFLHLKTRMNLRFLYIDNMIVIILSFLVSITAYLIFFSSLSIGLRLFFSLITGGIFIILSGYVLTMIRFWRSPKRQISALNNEIVSPADGNVIYIKQIGANETPISIKKGILNKLSELSKTTLLDSPCWLIGINMTPWDVHKNCAPISGKIILNQHTKGGFLSLKKFDSITINERNTYVIEADSLRIGVIQIASQKVRRIDSYKKEGEMVEKGEWLGMIRFGSQVDVILPYNANIKITIGQQIYAAKTVIASL